MLDFKINRMQFVKVFDGAVLFLRASIFVVSISTFLVIDVSVNVVDVHNN